MIRRLLPVLLLLVPAVAASWSPHALRLATACGIAALACLGYRLPFGRLGVLSLAQGAFFGLGAYAAAIAALGGVPPVAVPAVAALAAALVAAAASLPVLRLEAHYVALASLALAELLRLAVIEGGDLTGGANGLAGILAPVPPFGLGLVVWGAVAVAAGLSAWIESGLRGRAQDTARAAPMAAASLGLPVLGLRAQAFVAGAALAGLAGAFQLWSVTVASPDLLDLSTMIGFLAMSVIGGRRSIPGTIAGTALLTVLPDQLGGFDRYAALLYGVLLLAIAVAAPDGLAGLAGRLVRPRRREPDPGGHPLALPTFNSRHGAQLLRLDGLTRRFGGLTALDRVSLEVRAGEIVGLIGPNGSGKSTLVNLATGFDRPDAGTVTLSGRNVAGLPPHRIALAGIARSFQTPELPAGVSVRDAVLAGAAASPAGHRHAAAEALSWLDRLGLGGLAGEPTETVSQAAARRVELARALMRRPQVLVLDEPAAGLGDDDQAALARLLGELAGAGLGILLVDHAMGFLAPIATRLTCLEAGRVVASGPTDVVLADPAVAALYLGEGRDGPRA